MKRVYSLSLTLLVALVVWGQTHITISNPETWSAQELLPYVGQTVVFDQPMIISSNASSSNYQISPRRIFQPTNQVLPGSAAYRSMLSMNATGFVALTGVGGYHRCGERVYNLTAKVNSTSSISFISGTWRGNTRADLERGIPDLGDYRLLVCAMNLEYYLVKDFGTDRGPRNYSQHQDQRTKTNKALTKINADIYGLVEIQQGQDALEEIANDLNTKLPGRNYTYINDGTSANGTYTKSGYVYDANKVEPVGKMLENEEAVKGRKKMMCFREKATGERFIFSLNHFKAKSGSASGADADQGDGQGIFNATRTREAQSVIDQYGKYKRSINDDDILIMGDLNAYAKEDPVMLFVNRNFIDLHRAFHADSSYSYQFSNCAGYLDHAISNGSLYPQITGMASYTINSDENDRYTYDKSNDNTMFRSSDHDPVLVGLKLDSTLNYDPSPAINSAEIMLGTADKLVIRNSYTEGTPSYYAIYTINGLRLALEPITSNYHEVELPRESGVYICYLYVENRVLQRKIIVP